MPRTVPPFLASLSLLASNGWVAGAVALAAGTITGGALWVTTFGVVRMLPEFGRETATGDTTRNATGDSKRNPAADGETSYPPLSSFSDTPAVEGTPSSSANAAQSQAPAVRSATKRLFGAWSGKMEDLLPMRVEFRRDGAMHVTEYAGSLGPLAGSVATTWVVYREANGVYYLRHSLNDSEPDRDVRLVFLDDDRIQLTLPIDPQLAALSGRTKPMVAVLDREGSGQAESVALPKGAERIVGLWHSQLKPRDDSPMPGQLQLDFRDDGTLSIGVSQPLPLSAAPIYDEQHRARWKFVKSAGDVLTLDISDPQSDNRSTWTITFQGNQKMTLKASDDPQSKTFTRVSTLVR